MPKLRQSFILIITIMLLANYANATVTLLNNNVSDFPEVETHFLVIDNSINVILNQDASAGDIRFYDNGNITNITQFQQPSLPNGKASVVIAFDLGIGNRSGNSSDFTFAQTILNECISYYNDENTELSLISFSSIPTIESDFTSSFTNITNLVDNLVNVQNTNIYNSFSTITTGSISILDDANSPNKSVLLVTQGIMSSDNAELIISQAKQSNIIINILYVSDVVPENIFRIANETGGYCINSADIKKARLPFLAALAKISEGYSPYKMIANSSINCDSLHLFVIHSNNYGDSDFQEELERVKLNRIVSTPNALEFPSIMPGASLSKEISISATNSPATIYSITTDNPQFVIESGAENLPIILGQGEIKEITVRYNSIDSNITFAKILINSDACGYDTVYLTAGFPNIPPKFKTISINNPKCNEVLVIGDTIDISWIGVLPKDVVSLISYSKNSNQLDTFAKNIIGLKRQFVVPDNGEDSIKFFINQMWPNNIGQTLDFNHDTSVVLAFFNNYEDKIITVSSHNYVKIWNSNSGELIYTFPQFEKTVRWAKYCPTALGTIDNYIGVVCQDSTAYLFDANNYSLIWKYQVNNELINSIEFSADGKYALLARGNGYFDIVEVETGKQVVSKQINASNCRYAQFNPQNSNELMIITTYDGIIRFFDLDGNQTDSIDVKVISDFAGSVINSQYATYSPDGTKIAFVNYTSYVAQLIDINSQTILYSLSHNYDTTSKWIILFASFFQSPTENYIITSSTDKTIKRWNLADGTATETQFNFIEHRQSVNTCVFNSDGWRVLSSSNDSTAKIWNLNHKTLQADTTCMLKIAYARAKHIDTIDIGSAFVGDILIKTTDSAFQNICTFSYNIRSIRVVGDNPTDFSIIDEFNFPFIINGLQRLNFNIVFNPTQIGLRSAQLQIIIPNDTLYIQLIGMGMNIGLSPISNNINFGNIYVDDYKDTIIPYAINISGVDINIEDFHITGPQSNSYKLINISPANVIHNGDTLFLSIRFIPYAVGKRNALFTLTHNFHSNSLRCNLLGTGIDITQDTISLSVNNISAKIGSIVDFPFYLETITHNTNIDISEIKFSLAFNSSMLYPITNSSEVKIINSKYLDNGLKIVDISIPYKPGTQRIDGLQFMPTWGNDTMTAIDIINCEVNGKSRTFIRTNDAEFKILDYCTEGGLFLFDEDGKFSLEQNSPNPAVISTSINFTINENGFYQFSIYDLTGNLLQTYFAEHKQKGDYSITIPTTLFNKGVYFYTLETKSKRLTRQMIIK
jgi:WD40 repeat protein